MTEGATRTVPTAITQAAQRFPDNEAVVDGDVRLTYAQLHERVREIARMFIAEGVQPADRVAICSPNTHHWVVASLGALYCGATLVPINTRFTGHEIFEVLDRARARAFLVSGPFLGTDKLAEVRGAAQERAADNSSSGDDPVAGLPELRTVVRIPVESGELAPADGVLDWHDLDERAARVSVTQARERASTVDPDQPSDILFTSGTTGRSKGAVSLHRQVLDVARSWADHGELTSADRYLVINPFFHSFGYKAGILTCLISGATLVPQPVFDAESTMRLVERERITVLPGPPTIYRELINHPSRAGRDLSSVLIHNSSGEHCRDLLQHDHGGRSIPQHDLYQNRASTAGGFVES